MLHCKGVVACQSGPTVCNFPVFIKKVVVGVKTSQTET